jgi:glucose dehydrogenase
VARAARRAPRAGGAGPAADRHRELRRPARHGVTAGGLLFIAATPDEQLRAFDADTGALLWQTALPAAGFATPATYEAGGRQYLVIAAGGGKLGRPSGSRYVAFALAK